MTNRKITYLLENAGDIWGKSAFAFCVLSAIGGVGATGRTIGLMVINGDLIRKAIHLDLWFVLVMLFIFILCNEIVGLSSYRNATGVRDIGKALSSFFSSTNSVVYKGLSIALWASGLLVSIGVGCGIGLGLLHVSAKVFH